MSSIAQRLAFLGVFTALCAFGVITLTGPQGIPAYKKRMQEIRKLEEENANLRSENMLRHERIRKLREDPAEQDKVIREKLKQLHKGDTEFVVPEAVSPDSSQ